MKVQRTKSTVIGDTIMGMLIIFAALAVVGVFGSLIILTLAAVWSFAGIFGVAGLLAACTVFMLSGYVVGRNFFE